MKEEYKQKKHKFEETLREFIKQEMQSYVSTKDGDWKIKVFIDTSKNIYSISSDTKLVSKILEIHLFPLLSKFADENKFKLILADHQNYYPDISFVDKKDDKIKFAVDFKTSYRENKTLCNGFTLGSHGKYFQDRTSKKNIQFPYKEYFAHFCLGIIYIRVENCTIDETKIHNLNDLDAILSVIKDFEFFLVEKWMIASDKSGSGNTANIGSIKNIEDIINERGMFSKLGEKIFDEYWINYPNIKNAEGKHIKSLRDFLEYKNEDVALIVPKRNK